MIIVLKQNAAEEHVDAIVKKIEGFGLGVHFVHGKERTIIGAIGSDAINYRDHFISMAGVENIVPIMKPFKLASRELQQERSLVQVGDQVFGSPNFKVIAGPCSVENREMLLQTAQEVKDAGASLLRGGAFKPRTSPYSFQGLGEEGLKLLAEARDITGLPVVTEVMDVRDIELMVRYADMLQVGARNMQNFRLLKEVGQTSKPVILKRGMSATVEDLLMSAEYIISQGNKQVILCERGVRTFETATRNTLDLSAVPVINSLSHLPVVVDPSHATGRWDLVAPMAKAALAAGADGLMIEVHPSPAEALCDGPQSLKPERFKQLMDDLRRIALAVGRDL